ncbi:MAG: GNAT family N-acetyltransferase [Candidatus Melainabacteria bacterium]
MVQGSAVSERPKNTQYNAFRLLQAFRRSIHAIEDHSRHLMTDFGITGPKLHCLRLIGKTPGVTVGELSRQLSLSPGTTRNMVKRLELKAWVIRRAEPGQKRPKCLFLTAAGEDLVSRAPAPLEEQIEGKLNALNDEAQETLVRAFEQVVDMMDARHIDAAPLLETGPIDQSVEIKQAVHLLMESHRQSQQLMTDTHAEAEPPKVTLRFARATREKMDVVANFIRSADAWYRAIIHEDDLDEYQMSEDWVEKNFERREFYLGYTPGDQPVGTLSMQVFGRAMYLGYIYVDNHFVGQGFGHQFLEFARHTACERGLDSMNLLVHPRATWAVKAYQKYGFQLLYPYAEDILAWNEGALAPYCENGFQLFQYRLQR